MAFQHGTFQGHGGTRFFVFGQVNSGPGSYAKAPDNRIAINVNRTFCHSFEVLVKFLRFSLLKDAYLLFLFREKMSRRINLADFVRNVYSRVFFSDI